VHKQQEARRQALKAVNAALFKGSELYQSDFGEEFFLNKSGTSSLVAEDGQTLLLTSSKSLMNILATKTKLGSLQDPSYQREKAGSHGRRAKAGSTDGSHRSSNRGSRPRPSM